MWKLLSPCLCPGKGRLGSGSVGLRGHFREFYMRHTKWGPGGVEGNSVVYVLQLIRDKFLYLYNY